MEKYETWEEYLASEQDAYLDDENCADEDVCEVVNGYEISGQSSLRTYTVERVDENGIPFEFIGIYTNADLDDMRSCFVTKVKFSAGESRYNAYLGVDYMLAEDVSEDGTVTELYAEVDPAEFFDEKAAAAWEQETERREAARKHGEYYDREIEFDDLYTDEVMQKSYEHLKARIIEQAKENGIDPNKLAFFKLPE